MPPQASPVSDAERGRAGALDHGRRRCRRDSADVGADREIEAGGQHHQRQAGGDEESQARLPQHVEDVAEASGTTSLSTASTAQISSAASRR